MVKKLIQIILALAVMCCTLPLRGDTEQKSSYEIPIRQQNRSDLIRELCSIRAHYNSMFSAVLTSVAFDLGEIEVTVTNCSTGEVWYDTFDSSSISQHVLSISGTPGHYEVIYSVESGDLYEGTFVIE